MTQEDREQVKDMLDLKLGFVDFARVHFLSRHYMVVVLVICLSRFKKPILCATRRVGTSMLTRIMKMAEDDHQPLLFVDAV